MSGQQHANLIHNTINSADNELITNIFREMGATDATNNVAIIDCTTPLAELAGIQVGQYADINSNNELLRAIDVPQNMNRSLEGIIAERQISIAAAAAPTDDFESVRGQITDFIRKFFASAADHLKRTDIRSPSETEVNTLVDRGILNVQPMEDMHSAVLSLNTGLLASYNKNKNQLENFKSQSAYFFNHYAEVGRQLAQADQELKQRLVFFESTEKQLAALNVVVEGHPLHTAYFDYLRQKAEKLGIEESYKKYLTLSKEWAIMRDLALLHRIPANAENSSAPTCSVCLEDPITIVLQPCGHCFCTNCKGQIGRRCPLCRTNFTGSQRLYFA